MSLPLLRRLIHSKPFSFPSIQNPKIITIIISFSFSTFPQKIQTLENNQRFIRRETDLRRRILGLRFPRRSADAALDEWLRAGGKLTVCELRGIVVSLLQLRRYEHALQILSWLECHEQIHLSSSDHATKLDLIAKLQGTAQAEDYFAKLPITSKKVASFSLLHHYVKTGDLQKAETLMADLQNQGFALNSHLYDEMMKLYVAKFHFEKVFSVIHYMKINSIPLNVLSYNLWMNACSGFYGNIISVEKVLEEMMSDKNIELGWSTYVTLANMYTKYNLREKAFGALLKAEGKLSAKKRLGYSFLMTCYTNLNYKKGVMRLWELSQRVPYKITCTDFMCVMLCFIKMGDINEAERIFESWEFDCRKYDIRVSNVLLGAYVRKGLMEKAEKFHVYTLKKGAVPNYKTYEILMEGWLKNGKMEKAVEAMKKGFFMLKYCKWRPPIGIVEKFGEYFEQKGDLKEAEKYFEVVRNLNMISLALCKSLLRTYINADVMLVRNISLVMVKDGIELDEEIEELILRVKKMDFVSNG